MDETVRKQLQARFDFASWKQAPSEAAEISTRGLIQVGSELGGWTARRVQAVTVSGARGAYQSMWQQGASAETLLRLDVIEAVSAAAAREVVLELLGQFQSPEIRRLPASPPGDLAFGAPGDTVMLFARGNVVVMVRNAGRAVVAVADFAHAVDGSLVRGTGTSPG
jgi:hypothetical protein